MGEFVEQDFFESLATGSCLLLHAMFAVCRRVSRAVGVWSMLWRIVWRSFLSAARGVGGEATSRLYLKP